jgi:hypothetical protein
MKTWTSSPGAFVDGTALTPPEFEAEDLVRFRTEYFLEGTVQPLLAAVLGAAREAMARLGFEVAEPLSPCLFPANTSATLAQDALVHTELPGDDGKYVVVQAAFTLQTGPTDVGAIQLELVVRRQQQFLPFAGTSTGDGAEVLLRYSVGSASAPTDLKKLSQLKAHLDKFVRDGLTLGVQITARHFAEKFDRLSTP